MMKSKYKLIAVAYAAVTTEEWLVAVAQPCIRANHDRVSDNPEAQPQHSVSERASIKHTTPHTRLKCGLANLAHFFYLSVDALHSVPVVSFTAVTVRA